MSYFPMTGMGIDGDLESEILKLPAIITETIGTAVFLLLFF